MDLGLEQSFDEAMFGIYRRALKEAGYKASRFLDMLYTHRGLQTARILINSSGVSEGYKALWRLNRLDLTVEALIHDESEWHPLFDESELKICRQRLIDYRYIAAEGKHG